MTTGNTEAKYWNEENLQLANELAALTGESLEDAVIFALRERLERLTPFTADS